jgi:hypothetical protein
MKQLFFLAVIILTSFGRYAIAQTKVMKDPRKQINSHSSKEDILGTAIFKAKRKQ